MGCQCCSKRAQIIENPIVVKEEMKEEIDEEKIDFIKARKLVKLLISEDNLYKDSLNSILFFTDEEFENLFKGNIDYKNYPYRNIEDKIEFKNLLLKFEDYNSLLYEWYRDESKYDNLIKLWKSQLSVCELNKSNDEKLEEDLERLGITDMDNFIGEFRTVMNNTLESKAGDIRNYLKDEFTDFYSLITTAEEYKKDPILSNKENKKIFSGNLENIVKQLVQVSFPLVKNYITNNYLNLNMLSKVQLKSEMMNKLRKEIISKIQADKSIFTNGLGFENLSELVSLFKNGGIVNKLVSQTQMYFNNPCVAVSTLAMSFYNLSESVISYYKNKKEGETKIKHFKDKMDEIDRKFEKSKKEIESLDLNNYKESLKRIVDIGKKIYQVKKEIQETINNLEREEKEVTEKKEKSGLKKAIGFGGGMALSAIGFVATGGLLAGVYAASAVASGIAMGVQIANFKQLKKQLQVYGNMKEKENKKYKDIEDTLAQLNVTYNNLHDRYIPLNLRRGNN